MVEMRIDYTGDLRTRIVHGPSGTVIETDAPVDNQGLGERFSPTDLLAAALGSCALTIMGIAAKKRNLSLKGAAVRIEKHMQDSPRRVGRIVMDVTLPAALSEHDRTLMEKICDSCPVHLSICPDIKVENNFSYV
jgi:putative redox protein